MGLVGLNLEEATSILQGFVRRQGGARVGLRESFEALLDGYSRIQPESSSLPNADAGEFTVVCAKGVHMPLWKVNGTDLRKFEVTDFSVTNYEASLEEWLEANSDVIFEGEPLLWIGRQVRTEYGTIADLIGLDQDGRAVVVELKRDLTPRDIVSQALEYATWLAKLDPEELTNVAIRYFQKLDPGDRSSLREKFTEFFGDQDPPRFNRTQRVVLIGQEVSSRVLDVSKFLRGYGLDIYCMQFTYHETDGGEKLLLTEMTVGGDEPGELSREPPVAG